MSIQPAKDHIHVSVDASGRDCAYVYGTRVSVDDIHRWIEIERQTPHAIVSKFPQLSLADVYAALAYYFDREAEITAQISPAAASQQQSAQSDCLAIALRLGFIGSAPNAPADLGSNPAHMDGFGSG